MKINRVYTTADRPVVEQIEWKMVEVSLGKAAEVPVVEVPSHWSVNAASILADKYLRKAGVPLKTVRTSEYEVGDRWQPPGWLLPSRPTPGAGLFGHETSAKQVLHRLAGAWTYHGWREGYFEEQADARTFYDEVYWCLAMQLAAPNSPQWFNTGIWWAYGVEGPDCGMWRVDPDGDGAPAIVSGSYCYPQPHACQPSWATVSTPEGCITIGDIVGKNLVGMSIYDGSGVASVVAHASSGEKVVKRVRLSSGNYVDATDEHLVWACAYDHRGKQDASWERVADLKVGMRLYQRFGTTISGRSDISSQEGYLVGFLQGDGHQSRTQYSRTCVEFVTVNDDEYGVLVKCLDAVFPGREYKVRDLLTDADTPFRHVRMYGDFLSEWLDAYEITSERWAENMRVPPVIMSGGAIAVRSYLCGFFQADGCVRTRERGGTHSSDVVLGSISYELLRDAQHLLQNCGIYSRLSSSSEQRGNRKDYFHLSIGYLSEREKFRELIGFVGDDKQAKLEASLSLGGKRLGSGRWEEIVSIDNLGVHPVFDIQTTTGAYLTNNLLVHNCFLTPTRDDLVNEGGIMDTWHREARIFKYGSGSGVNASAWRSDGERLSGGGFASGVMGWLRIGDSSAGAIHSGGTTRRAAKMVMLDDDHPDLPAFVDWKLREEYKAAAMYVGSQVLRDVYLGNHSSEDPMLDVPQQMLDRFGEGMEPHVLGKGFEEEANRTIDGQNSNNSVRITDALMAAVDADADWHLRARTTGEVVKTIRARELWNSIVRSAWACADPGVIFHDTVNAWHTTPAGGPIRTTNPCSEFHSNDGNACFTGETKVWTVDGPRRFDDLAASGKTVAVLTELDDGSLAYRDMVLPRKTRVNSSLVEVTFKARGARGRKNSFTTLRVTPDHLFYLRDGTTRAAVDLTYGDSVESAYRSGEGYPTLYTTSGDWVRDAQLRRRSLSDSHIRRIADVINAGHRRRAELGLPSSTSSLRKLRRGEPMPDGWRLGRNGRTKANHTVVGVRHLDALADVYCGTVPSTGRFFVSLGDDHREGVLVKNCNLASLNLVGFLLPDGRIDAPRYEHVLRLFTIILDISNSMASFPAREFAVGAYEYRTIGLGYMNLGALLMRMGLPYDSDEGRNVAASMTALMTGVAYRTSAELAGELGPFPRWGDNVEAMRAVMRKHYDALDDLVLSPLTDEVSLAASRAWISVLDAEAYRNAQATLVAPTGTIHLLCDCDTSGVEPDYALKKHKRLAGGGYMDIVNQSVEPALRALGYDSHAREGIMNWLGAYGSMDGCGDLRAEHHPVFHCVAELDPMAHVRMVAAIQPFLSGASSKTVNLPREAAVADVDRVLRETHRLGVKAISVYRDGSKLAQPLASAKPKEAPVVHLVELSTHNGQVAGSSSAGRTTAPAVVGGGLPTSHSLARGAREYLPWRRDRGYTQKAKIGGQTIFWRVSEFPDGRPGEVFIELAFQGSTLRATADSVAIAWSVALQHGVPLAELVDKYVNTKFEPSGYVEGHDRIKFASSFTDLIARDLAITYLGRDDLANVVMAASVEDPERLVALDRRAAALTAAGATITGATCPECGGLTVQTGTCRTCTQCSYNEGCG